jgi:hypothetical protein
MANIRDNEECYAQENISLKLASYDDIFSDFDPRPYSERSLSVDFLDEAKRASIDKPSGEIQLRLIVPKKIRDIEKERVIQKRLKAHFERHAGKIESQHKNVIRNGAIFTITGIMIMLIATFTLFGYSENNLFVHFLLIIFEPAGWFLFWEGLDQVLFESKKTRPEMEFYEKMAKTETYFLTC